MIELIRKFGEGNIERCDDQPLLERSRIVPAPVKGCLEDLVYLVEMSQHIERLSQQQGLNESKPGPRSRTARSAAAACVINPFQSCPELERDYQFAQLSDCAYDDHVQVCSQDWEAVDPSTLGLDDSLFNHGSFSATLFYNAQTDEYVVAYRGTDDAGDWKDNVLQSGGDVTDQYQRAVDLAIAVQKALPNETLSFTGHSLGGGLATAAALSVNAPARVFNPSALHPKTAATLGLDYALAPSLVKVTTVDGDLLTTMQASGNFTLGPGEVTRIDQIQSSGQFPAPGDHTMIGAPGADWINDQKDDYPLLARGDSIILHSIDAVLESEKNMLVEDCGITPPSA